MIEDKAKNIRREKQNAASRRWRSKHKEEHYEATKKWTRAHGENKAESNRKYRAAHLEEIHVKSRVAQKKYREKYPDRAKAAGVFGNAVRRGKITRPGACSVCRKKNIRIEGHHFDYGKPLELTWLCVKCHRDLHVNIRDRQGEKH